MRVPKVYADQLRYAVDHGYLPVIQREAARIGETTAQILAICSRETNMRNIRGDFRNGVAYGFGLMQVDRGTDPHFAGTWSASNFEAGVVRGCDIYQQKFEIIRRNVGQPVTVKNRRGQAFRFTGRQVDRDDLRRIATAAYNNGMWPYLAFSKHQHIDSYTTGQDYGRDVYQRAIYFAILLETWQIEQDAFRSEVARQGDYALEAHQKLAQVVATPDDREMLEPAPFDADALPEKVSPADVGNYQIRLPQQQQTAQQESVSGSDVSGAQQGGVKVFLQSLKSGYDDLTMGTGLTIAALWSFIQSNWKLIAVVAGVALVIYFNRKYTKLQIDRQVINTAADPNLNTVRPDKRAK